MRSANPAPRGERHRAWPPDTDASSAVTSATVGLTSGLTCVVTCASSAALILAGPLQGHIPLLMGAMLASGAVLASLTAYLSSFPGTIAMPQDRTAPLLALLVAAVIAALPPDTPEPVAIGSALLAIVVTTFITGGFLLVLGGLRLGGYFRFIPYPVIGGFLAGTGWLLVLGALRVMHPRGQDFSVTALAEPGALAIYAPGTVFALVLVAVLRVRRHFMILPGALGVALIASFVYLESAGPGVSSALADGFFVGPFVGGAGYQFHLLETFSNGRLDLILAHPATIATVILVSALSVLLSFTALEVETETDVRLNHELRVAGGANLAVAALGGVLGFVSMSLSSLAVKMGARGRANGMFTAVVCALVLIVGMDWLAYLPRLVLGGLLMFLGISFLFDWLIDGWRRLSRGDYTVVALIVATVSVAGYLQGVAVGLTGAIVLFVVNYSRVNVIKHDLSGTEVSSNVDRPVRHARLLKREGEQLRVLRLQGFIFFGTANRLVNDLRARLGAEQDHAIRFLVLDFHRVTGVDSSVELSFRKLLLLAVRAHVEVVLTGLTPALRSQLNLAQLARSRVLAWREFSDLDHGLEWCEDQLLSRQTAVVGDLGLERISGKLAALVGSDIEQPALYDYMDRLEIGAGETLIRRGNPSDALYFIESGSLAVELPLGDGKQVRVRKLGAGTVTGELGLYLRTARTATVSAAEDTVVYVMRLEAIVRMKEANPQMAAAFHQYMAGLLAERLVNTNQTLRAALD